LAAVRVNTSVQINTIGDIGGPGDVQVFKETDKKESRSGLSMSTTNYSSNMTLDHQPEKPESFSGTVSLQNKTC
jgi:hypothetical protein